VVDFNAYRDHANLLNVSVSLIESINHFSTKEK
jgi:hypothetical protein